MGTRGAVEKRTRKAISKLVRFEVFKRDSFTCQYCGVKAPDVLLEVDHIKPVSKGGTNELVNYVTACAACNSGKGHRELSDRSVVTKQRRQLEDLQVRREQLEMMLAWREGLVELREEGVERLIDHWSALTKNGLTRVAEQKLRRLIREHGVAEIMDAMDIASERYLEFDGCAATPESDQDAFRRIATILSIRREVVERPYLKDLFYIRKILLSRVVVPYNAQLMDNLKHAVEAGAEIDVLKRLAKTARNWTEFDDDFFDYVQQLRKAGEG